VRRLEPFERYLRQRVAAYPGLTASRLLREIKELGYAGGYTAVTDLLREVRPSPVPPFEVRFETPPGEQAQVDFAHFEVIFADEPGAVRKVCCPCCHGDARNQLIDHVSDGCRQTLKASLGADTDRGWEGRRVNPRRCGREGGADPLFNN
jgi:hypothetical protein